MTPSEKLCASLQTIDFIENCLGEDSPHLAFLIGTKISTLWTKLNENIWFSETVTWHTYERILSWATSVWKFNHLSHPDKCFHHFQRSAGRHKNLETLLLLNLASQPSLSFIFWLLPSVHLLSSEPLNTANARPQRLEPGRETPLQFASSKIPTLDNTSACSAHWLTLLVSP